MRLLASAVCLFMMMTTTAFSANLRRIIILPDRQQCEEEGLCLFQGDDGNPVCGECE